MDTERYSINTARTICETTPFFVRGRKLLLFLEAVAHPLVSIHDEFKKWAVERNIEASVTSQILPLQWYLTYKFKSIFLDKTNSFRIIDNTMSDAWLSYKDEHMAIELKKVLTNVDEENLPEGFTNLRIENSTESDGAEMSEYTIIAPAIQEIAKYTNVNYLNDIRKIMSKYLTTQVKYEITISKP